MARRAAALAGAALLVSIAAPASAGAAPAVSATPNGCIRYAKPFTNVPAFPSFGVAAGGWTPNTPLSFAVGKHAVGTGTTDAGGTFASGLTFTPPKPPNGKNLVSTTLDATDSAGNVATTAIKVVRLTVAVPKSARPSQRVRYRAFGFSPQRKVYLYVRRGNKTRGRFVIGRPTGACGRVTKKLRYMPLKHFSVGTYQFLFTQTPKFAADQVLSQYGLVLKQHHA